MIKSFKDKTSEDIYDGYSTKDARKVPQSLWNTACRKLDMLNAAHEIKDLLVPPGNRLERLKGNLAEYHSIRINDQYRIVFRWSNGNVESVEITDYH